MRLKFSSAYRKWRGLLVLLHKASCGDHVGEAALVPTGSSKLQRPHEAWPITINGFHELCSTSLVFALRPVHCGDRCHASIRELAPRSSLARLAQAPMVAQVDGRCQRYLASIALTSPFSPAFADPSAAFPDPERWPVSLGRRTRSADYRSP